MEHRLRAVPEQFLVLIEFMERNGDLSKPQPGLQGRIRSDQLWQELAISLNSVTGGVQKTTDKWKKVWADWKAKTKKKYRTIRQAASNAGSSRHFLTHLEERVVYIIGVPGPASQAIKQEQGSSGSLNVAASSDTVSPSEEPCPDVGGGAVEYLLFEAGQNNEAELILSSPPARNIVSPGPAHPDHCPTHPDHTLTHPDHSLIHLDHSPTHPDHSSTQPDHSPTDPFESPSRSSSTHSNLSPSHPSSPPPPRISPARKSRTQASPSPASIPASSTRRRSRRRLTPFDRAAEEFAAIEQRRLEFEERRDKRLHERELRRLEVDRMTNKLLQRLSDIGQNLIDMFSQRSNQH